MDSAATLAPARRGGSLHRSAAAPVRRWSSVALALLLAAVVAYSSGCIVATGRVDGDRRVISQTETGERPDDKWRLVAIEGEPNVFALDRAHIVRTTLREEVDIVERRSWPEPRGAAYWTADVLCLKYAMPLFATVAAPFAGPTGSLDHGIGLIAPPVLPDSEDHPYAPLGPALLVYPIFGGGLPLPARVAGLVIGPLLAALNPVVGAMHGVLYSSPLDIIPRFWGTSPRAWGSVAAFAEPWWEPSEGIRSWDWSGTYIAGGARKAYVDDINYWQNLLDWPLRWLPGYPGFTAHYALEESVVGSRIDVTHDFRIVWRRVDQSADAANAVHVFVGWEPAQIEWRDDGSFRVDPAQFEPWANVDDSIWMWWWDDLRSRRQRDYGQLLGHFADHRDRLPSVEDHAFRVAGTDRGFGGRLAAGELGRAPTAAKAR